MVRKKQRNQQDAEDSWLEYFTKIKKVCPWSYSAYVNQAIDFDKWSNTYRPKPLSQQARIVICRDKKARWLKKTADKFMQLDPDNEWLWSHPQYGNNSTPVPCLIQQNQERLSLLRKQLFTDGINNDTVSSGGNTPP